jgi:penicillin-insensitive murein endopeptidase
MDFYTLILPALHKLKKLSVCAIFLLSTFSSLASSSTCYGTTSNGSLQNGVQLPKQGTNFVGYSEIARLAGRTYVHSRVKDIILDAYSRLEKSEPDKVFKYAETGFVDGGKFRPHKTHQNGLSVDFMTPVLNESGKSVHLPTHPFNKFGYNIEFDDAGQFDEYRIDYDALSAHLVALHKSSKKHGVDLWRVIFDPKLQPNLFKTKYGDYLKTHIQFSKKRSWVRHDEHYHVDFAVPCDE